MVKVNMAYLRVLNKLSRSRGTLGSRRIYVEVLLVTEHFGCPGKSFG